MGPNRVGVLGLWAQRVWRPTVSRRRKPRAGVLPFSLQAEERWGGVANGSLWQDGNPCIVRALAGSGGRPRCTVLDEERKYLALRGQGWARSTGGSGAGGQDEERNGSSAPSRASRR
jgi:hypothetical protein